MQPKTILHSLRPGQTKRLNTHTLKQAPSLHVAAQPSMEEGKILPSLSLLLWDFPASAMFPQNAEGYQGWEGKELWPRSCTNCMLDGAWRSSQNLCMWSWNPWLCSCLPLPILHHSTTIANPVFRPTLNWKTTGFIFSTCNFYIQSFFFF